MVNEYQLFYGLQDWNESLSVKEVYQETGKKQEIEFIMPCSIDGFRFDLGDTAGIHQIHRVFVAYKKKKWEIPLTQIEHWCKTKGSYQQITDAAIEGDLLKIKTSGTDSYILGVLPDIQDTVIQMRQKSMQIRYGLIAVFLDILFIVLLFHYNRCYELAKEVFLNRRLIYKLAKNDFKTRFAGSFFGMFWAFVQPVITILIYWFVFSVGFRSAAEANLPFALWLTAGMVPWFFFSEAWSGATNSLIEYSYLVKKVVFKISVLPIVKVMSAIFVSLFFHAFMCIMFIGSGYFPDQYWLQLVYYLFCNFALALSLSYLTCSIIPFFKDLSQIMNIILQMGIWITPILWNINILPQTWRWVMKINPMYYIVQGYRNVFGEKVWFWQDITWTIYFWAVVGALFVAGNLLFKKMRPHFADVI